MRNLTKVEFSNCRLSPVGLLGVASLDRRDIPRADEGAVLLSVFEAERVETVGVVVVEVSLALDVSLEIVISSLTLAVSSNERRRRRPDNVRRKL